MATEELLFDPFPAQQRFLEAVFSGKYNRLCLAGSIRSGKTYDCIAALLALSRIFPRSKWLIVRKDWPRLRTTTMEVFNRLCPSSFVKKKFNPLTREVVFMNDSRILFMNEAPGAAKDQPFRGLYINGAFPDEANELEQATIEAVKSRLGSHKESFILGEGGQKIYPPSLMLLSCNPNQGWMKEQFYLRAQNNTLPERHYFQNITIEENPYITPEDMAEFSDWPEDLLNKFIKGSWDALDDEHQLIKWGHINGCIDTLPDQPEEYYLGAPERPHARPPRRRERAHRDNRPPSGLRKPRARSCDPRRTAPRRRSGGGRVAGESSPPSHGRRRDRTPDPRFRRSQIRAGCAPRALE